MMSPQPDTPLAQTPPDYATFGDLAPIPITIAANGKMQYNLATITSPTYIKYDRDNIRSRWTAQLSARVRF